MRWQCCLVFDHNHCILNHRSVYKPMFGSRENASTHVDHFIWLHVEDGGRVVGWLVGGRGLVFFPAVKLRETWCYAISWCAMFVLYTGSGEMLLLTTDSGVDRLSVVLFSAVWAMFHDAVVSSWRRWWCHTVVTRVLMRSQWRQLWMLLDVVMQKNNGEFKQ